MVSVVLVMLGIFAVLFAIVLYWQKTDVVEEPKDVADKTLKERLDRHDRLVEEFTDACNKR